MRVSYLLANLFIIAKVFAREGADDNSIDINVINPFDDNGNHTLVDDHGKHHSSDDDHHSSDDNHHSTDDNYHLTDDNHHLTDDHSNHTKTSDVSLHYDSTVSTTATAVSDRNTNINNSADHIKSSLFYVFLGSLLNIFF